MRVTIIREDNMVHVDGEARAVDCSDLPAFFHALQWYGEGDPPYGEIEYAIDNQGRKMPNTRFSDIAPYSVYVERWHAAAPAE